MKNFIDLDKEYHPVIEEFISDYVDEEMGSVERESFEEVLVHDDDLRELVFSAKDGKRLIQMMIPVKAREGFIERLREKLR